jgi:RHS repeat-associated protein
MRQVTGAKPVQVQFTPHGFPGQLQTLPDLWYNRYRDYDPTTGRYIQADPIGLDGDANPYAYALNNPLRYTDPTGEFVPILIGIAVGVGLEYLTNPCATTEDLVLAGAIGGIGGGIGQLRLLRYGSKALTRETGLEWSHSLSKRLVDKFTRGPLRRALNRRGGFNGSWATPQRHYRHDPFRFPKGWKQMGDRYNPFRAGVDRMPDWLKASLGSGGVGSAVSGVGDD